MTKINPQFAIIAAGFRSGSLAHLNYYEDVITIPSLHVFGESDSIITSNMSKSLAECFDDKTIVEHPGGHYFAAGAVERRDYIDFVKRQLDAYSKQKELKRGSAVVIDPLDGIASTSNRPIDISYGSNDDYYDSDY